MNFAIDGYKLLSEELASFRELSYDELVQLIGAPGVRRVRTRDSTEYAIQVSARWRDGEGGDILVEGWVAVDDCGPMRRLDDRFEVKAP
jgi:hypothetical protein